MLQATKEKVSRFPLLSIVSALRPSLIFLLLFFSLFFFLLAASRFVAYLLIYFRFSKYFLYGIAVKGGRREMESTNYLEMNAISRDGWIAEMSINNNLLIQIYIRRWNIVY